MKANGFMKRSIKLKSLYLDRLNNNNKKRHKLPLPGMNERTAPHIYITKIDSRRNRNHKSYSIFKI